jgi:hypothetical protein
VAKYVFVEVPLEHTVWLKKDFVSDKVGHINFYSPITIRRLVQTCNLEVVRQITINSSRATYVYQFGERAGRLRYMVKELLLKTIPCLATMLLTYNAALLCKRT